MHRATLALVPPILLCAAPAVAQFAVGGISIDPDGLLVERTRPAAGEPTFPDPSPGDEVGRSADLRVVSLARLERAVVRRHAAGQPLPPELSLLHGLRDVRFVFFAPNDVLIAGPAGGWRTTPVGDVVGDDGRPVMLLDDLVVALRYALATKPTAPFIGCSIDPTPEGTQQLANFLRRAGVNRPNDALLSGMAQAMGPQNVRVFGVPADTRFALGLVAADYRLKRLAMGHDRSRVRGLASYVDVATSGRLSTGGFTAPPFWFAATCDAVLESPDSRSFELRGVGFELRSSPSFGDGKESAPSSPAGRFTTAFNARIDEVVSSHTEFGGLRNRIVLALVAELVARKHLAGGRGAGGKGVWWPAGLLDDEACPVERLTVPKAVPSLAGARMARNRRWFLHVSGGVSIDPATLVEDAVEPGDEVPSPPRAGRVDRAWWDADQSPKAARRAD